MNIITCLFVGMKRDNKVLMNSEISCEDEEGLKYVKEEEVEIDEANRAVKASSGEPVTCQLNLCLCRKLLR